MTQIRTLITMVALLIVVSVMAVPVAANPTPTNTTNATNTTTQMPSPSPTSSPTSTLTASETGCEPREGGPKIQVARLYSPEPTITQDEHGRISGTITVDIQNECPVVAQLTLTVPSGMYLAGAGDLSSGGGGVITSTFVVQPGETKNLRGNVYSSSVGDRTVTGDITFYPQGHKSAAREIDGLMAGFTVEGENMPGDPQPPATTSTPTTTEPNEGGSGGDGGWSIIEALLGLVGITQVGLLVIVGLGLVMMTRMIPDKFDFDFGFRKD